MSYYAKLLKKEEIHKAYDDVIDTNNCSKGVQKYQKFKFIEYVADDDNRIFI